MGLLSRPVSPPRLSPHSSSPLASAFDSPLRGLGARQGRIWVGPIGLGCCHRQRVGVREQGQAVGRALRIHQVCTGHTLCQLSPAAGVVA